MMSRREVLLAGAAAPLTNADAPVPQVPFGRSRISRLIVGGNPVSGNSHVSGALSREMTDYFTAANVKRLLRACEEAGINVWQSRGDRHILRLLHEYRLEGGRIQWIAQTATELADFGRNVREIASEGPIGIYHHGSSTDAHWHAGTIDAVAEHLKIMRQSGTRVGLGTHIPEVIDYAESKGWDLDFYMACVYNLARPKAEAERLAGRPLDGEFFWDPDRERMLERIRRTPKQCLIFKVYAASRKCDSPAQMEAALALALRHAKPSDTVVIGMYPKRSEQVNENCRLFARALAARG